MAEEHEHHPGHEGHEAHSHEHEAQHNHEPHHEAHHEGAKTHHKKPVNLWMIVSGILVILVIVLIAYLVVSQAGPKPPITPLTGQKALVEEFSDFQCPACGVYFPIAEQLKTDYSSKITFVYRHFPLSYHQFAQKSAEASECARDQGKFEEYYKLLFNENIRAYAAKETEPKLDVPNLKSYAKQLGLDSGKFDSCLDSGSKASAIQVDVTEANKRSLDHTPTFYIDGKEFKGQSLQEFKAAVDSALAAKAGGTVPSPDQNKPDPEFNLVEIEDSTCTVCNQSQLPLLLTSSAFPSAKTVAYKASSSEGKKFIADYNLNILPAFLLEKNVEQAKNFPQLGKYLEKNGDYYIFPYALMDQIASQAGPIYAARRWLNVTVPTDSTPVLGNSSSKVKFVSFEDYQCPFCKRYETDTYPKIKENYIDSNKIAYYFKDYQFLGADSTTAGNAGHCVFEQGNDYFWKFFSIMFAKQGAENGGWASESNIKDYMNDINGLDQNKFEQCLSSKKYADRVLASQEFGRSLGGFGTPTLFINNIQVQGAYPYETFKQIIDDELAAQAS